MVGTFAGDPESRMLPDVLLFEAGGRAIRLTEYRHRKHLVLLVFQAPPGFPGSDILHALSARYPEFAEENAEILAVFPGLPPSTPDSPVPDPCRFPVLGDRDGSLMRSLSGQRAEGNLRIAVCVADRYGEIFRSFDVVEGNPFPLEEILAWLRFLERLCPE